MYLLLVLTQQFQIIHEQYLNKTFYFYFLLTSSTIYSQGQVHEHKTQAMQENIKYKTKSRASSLYASASCCMLLGIIMIMIMCIKNICLHQQGSERTKESNKTGNFYVYKTCFKDSFFSLSFIKIIKISNLYSKIFKMI